MEKNHAKPIYAFIFFNWLLLSFFVRITAQRNATVPVKVGIVLDLNRVTGKMGLSCIKMSLSDFYESHSDYRTRLVFNVRNSQNDVVTAATQALDLIKKEEVRAIIGPSTSMEANFIINLGEKAQVPILSFSATSPLLSSLKSSYFFQIAKADSAQVDVIISIIHAFGWKATVPIYVDNDYGVRIIPFLVEALQLIDVRIPYLSVISASATNDEITKELYKLMTMQTRVFILHMTDIPGSNILAIANQIGMMNQGYVWILTDGIGNILNSINSSVKNSMEGVLVVKSYVPRTKELDDFNARLKTKFLQDNTTLFYTNLNVFGLWAYDATMALAMAIEKVGAANFGFNVENTSSNLSNFERLRVSQYSEKVREALSNTRFKGLSGEFTIVRGQLQASTFEIVNIIGNGEKRIGYWTPQNGLIRNLVPTTSAYSTSKNNLGTIIWPGDTSSVPKGWEIPTNGKKLRIGVPVKPKDSYVEFVGVTYNPSTNTTKVTGFSIDIFKAALEVLPYALPYEFIPYGNPENGKRYGSYNDLVHQVYYGNFDAAVGDISITADRSNYVDFTVPHTESGLTMVVPVRDSRKKNAWTFLKPLTWDLWVTTACSFIFIGFVVWILEHRINENFRGPPSYQIGTSLWFSFSTMTFSHRENVISNLGRPVVIIWLFVVLILVQSYTASLTSLLTVDQLRPTLTDVNQLIKDRLNVGYTNGSYMYDILKSMGLQDSQLKPYTSMEHSRELFERGPANGGIAAIFGEIPYLKIFIGTYCSKYTMVGPTFQSGGFGFAFPKGSSLVADISRAILNVSQGDKMKTIENAWLKTKSCPPQSDTSVSSNSLGLDSFWGLFLIAWTASILALVIFAITFLYQHRNIWFHYNAGDSIWRRVGILVRVFDEKDLSSHTFKKSETSSAHRQGLNTVQTSPSGDQCPSSEAESFFSFSGDVNPSDHPSQDTNITIVGDIPAARTTTPELVPMSH